jgi:hypothetical protein
VSLCAAGVGKAMKRNPRSTGDDIVFSMLLALWCFTGVALMVLLVVYTLAELK